MPLTDKETKQIAWVIFHKKMLDIGNIFFKTQKLAKEYLKENAYHKNPLVMKEVLKNYKVIKATISY